MEARLQPRAGGLSIGQLETEQDLAVGGPRRQRLRRPQSVLRLRACRGIRVGFREVKVLVLGAGVIGTTTAWFLREQGHDVTVVERHSAAALETSFANGGQISVSHGEPWANPQAPFQILKWVGEGGAAALFRPRPDLPQGRWGAAVRIECP